MSQYPSGLNEWNATSACLYNMPSYVMPSLVPQQQLHQNPMQDNRGSNVPVQMYNGMTGTYAPYNQQAIAGNGAQTLSHQVVSHLNQTQQNNLANQAPVAQSVSSSSDTTESTNLHVRRLHQKVDEKSLTAVFSQFGYVVSSLVMRNIHTGHSLGTGFVRFRSHADAKHALEQMQGRKIMGKDVIIEWAQLQTELADAEEQGKRMKKCGQSQMERARSKKLFIRNIPRTVTMAELCGLFTPYGVVENVTVHEDTQPNPKLAANEQRIIAFISFMESGSAMHACDAIHSTTPFPACNGTRLLVKVVQVNQETPATSSFFNGCPTYAPHDSFLPASRPANTHSAAHMPSYAASSPAGASQAYNAPSQHSTRSAAIIECDGISNAYQYQYEVRSPESPAILGNGSAAVASAAAAPVPIPMWSSNMKPVFVDAQVSPCTTSINGDLTDSGEDHDDATSFRSVSYADGVQASVFSGSAVSVQTPLSRSRVLCSIPTDELSNSSSTPSLRESPLKRISGKSYRHNPYSY